MRIFLVALFSYLCVYCAPPEERKKPSSNVVGEITIQYSGGATTVSFVTGAFIHGGDYGSAHARNQTATTTTPTILFGIQSLKAPLAVKDYSFPTEDVVACIDVAYAGSFCGTYESSYAATGGTLNVLRVDPPLIVFTDQVFFASTGTSFGQYPTSFTVNGSIEWSSDNKVFNE